MLELLQSLLCCLLVRHFFFFFSLLCRTRLNAMKNPIKCHEEVLSLQPIIPPIRFDILPPPDLGISEGLDAFRFFFKRRVIQPP